MNSTSFFIQTTVFAALLCGFSIRVDASESADSKLIFWSTVAPSGPSEMVDPFYFGETCAVENRPLLLVQTSRGITGYLDRFAFFSMTNNEVYTNCSSYMRFQIEGDFSHKGFLIAKEDEWTDIRTLTKLGAKRPCPADICEANSNKVLTGLNFVAEEAGIKVKQVQFFSEGFVAISGKRDCNRHDDCWHPSSDQDFGLIFKINPSNNLKAELIRVLTK